jgi:hypothetical protein
VRRFAIAAGVTVLAAVLLAAPAQAALFLVFSKSSAAPGDVVRVRTGGEGALLEPVRRGELRRGPRVFLAPKAAARSIRSTRDSRLKLIGRLIVDRKGNGRLTFTVPSLRPGEYTTFVHCVPCGRYSNGRTLLATGPFSGTFRIKRA